MTQFMYDEQIFCSYCLLKIRNQFMNRCGYRKTDQKVADLPQVTNQCIMQKHTVSAKQFRLMQSISLEITQNRLQSNSQSIPLFILPSYPHRVKELLTDSSQSSYYPLQAKIIPSSCCNLIFITTTKAEMQPILLSLLPQSLSGSLALLVLLSLLRPSIAQYQLSPCFATYHAIVIGSNSSSYSWNASNFPASGYTYNMTWLGVYPNITSSSYTLSGFKINDNLPISYVAILSASAITGTFTLVLDSNSSIIYAAFSIILLSQCNSGIVYMKRVQHINTLLDQLVRNNTQQKQYFSVASQFCFSDPSDYFVKVFLSSFRANSYLHRQHVEINLYLIQPYNITFEVAAYSGNTLMQVTITYIVAQISTFQSKLMFAGNYIFDQAPLPTHTFTTNFGVPSVFSPNLTQKFILGFRIIFFQLVGWGKPSQVYYINSGTPALANMHTLVNINMHWIAYDGFTIMECDIHNIVDVINAPTLCHPCSDAMPNCVSCTSPTKCIGCVVEEGVVGGCTMDPGCIVVDITNPSICIACAAGFLLTNSQCLCPNSMWVVSGGCTNVILCATVITNSTSNASTCIACLPTAIFWNYQCYCQNCYRAVAGGCTNVNECISVVTNNSTNTSTCTACLPGSFLNSSSLCSCQTGYWLVSNYCSNIIGCITVKAVGNQVVCVFCNVVKRYELTYTACQCIDGFVMDSTGQCQDRCGDEKMFQDQCDDGNTDSGDGCSSTCKNETNFLCYNGSQTHKSECVYVRRDFKLKLKSIDKTNQQNQGIFTFKVHPPFNSLDKLNPPVNLQFNCDGRGQFVSWKYSAGTLVLKVNYQQNLEGNPANITITFNPTFILQDPYTILFGMVSQGDKLIIVKDQGKCRLLIIFMTVLCFFVLFLFAVGSLAHKMIGVEILHAFQTIFLLQALSNNITPVFGLLRYLSLSAGNFLFLSNAQTHIYRSQSDIHYSSHNQESSEAIIVGVSIFLSLCIMPFLYAWAQSVDDPQNNRNNLSTKVLRVIYGCLLFPFIIGFLIVNLLNTVIDCQQGPMFEDLPVQLSSALSLILVLISSLIMFFEVKLLFIKKNCWTTLQGLPRCERAYIPYYLIYVLILSLVTLFDYHQDPEYSLELITVIVLAFFVYMVLKRPYESNLHNAGQIMNVLMIVYFVGWMIAREYFPQTTTQQNQIFCMFLLCSLMATCIVLSSVRIVDEWKEKCKVEEAQPKIDKRKTLEKRKQEWNKQKQSLQQILHSLNPFCGEVTLADAKLQQIDKINQQRLMEDNECLYSKKNIEANLLNMPTTLYRRRKESKGISAEKQSPNQRPKDHPQNHSAKKQNK